MTQFTWGCGPAALTFSYDADSPVRACLGTPDTQPSIDNSQTVTDPHHAPAPRALVEILAVGHGRALTSTRCERTLIGERMRLVSHTIHRTDDAEELVITQHDPVTGLTAQSLFTRLTGVENSWRTRTIVTNEGQEPVALQMVSSLALVGLSSFLGDDASTQLWSARSEWCGESRWYATPLTSQRSLIDINPRLHGQAGRGTLGLSSTSTWSSGSYLPVAALENLHSGHALIWQMEVPGPWGWELSTQREACDAYTLLLHGPDDLHHSWLLYLKAGDSFESIPVSLAFSHKGITDAVASLTHHRRASHRPYTADRDHPLIFNDYMNALMGDPDVEKLIPLIDAAATAGAQRFCIDAGWYDDGGYWWDSVGEWLPSTTRFGASGLIGVLDYIRSKGMEPGLWVEPEVIGVKSPLAHSLSEDAFMHRAGQRIVEHERYFLDLRSTSARAHLDRTFQRLIEDYGVSYFKWDYNVTPGSGPDDAPYPGQAHGNGPADGVGYPYPGSPGAGLLDHARAHLNWFHDLRTRYPHVIFEACSSGAQRMDPAIAAHYDLQSTSDQQDYRLYPTIAAAAPMSLVPEQAGNWAYPQQGMSPEQVAFTMVTGLSGRLYLSGRLDQMGSEHMKLIQEATRLYPEIMAHQCASVPRWPLGLPQWDAPVVALVTHCDDQDLLFLWKRSGAGSTASTISIPLPDAAGLECSAQILYPSTLEPWDLAWMPASGTLVVDWRTSSEGARIIRITH